MNVDIVWKMFKFNSKCQCFDCRICNFDNSEYSLRLLRSLLKRWGRCCYAGRTGSKSK